MAHSYIYYGNNCKFSEGREQSHFNSYGPQHLAQYKFKVHLSIAQTL